MDLELDNTEVKIVNATFKLLQQDGVEKTTTKKIASEAGINEVTIFRKFKNKKNLIEITKEYYIQIFINKLKDIFDFDEDEEIGEYLENNFNKLLNLSDGEFSVIKVAMEEVRGIPDKKLLISRITNTILNKFEEFFELQIKKGKIRDVNPRALGIMCFSTTFQSIVLCKVYNDDSSFETNNYSETFLDILFNGIKPLN